jgi:hypothetical protein
LTVSAPEPVPVTVLRSEATSVGVVSAAGIRGELGPSSENAAEGIAQGAEQGLDIGFQVAGELASSSAGSHWSGGAGVLLGLVVLPLSVLGGGIYGLIETPSQESLQADALAINRRLASFDPDRLLELYVAGALRSRTGRAVRPAGESDVLLVVDVHTIDLEGRGVDPPLLLSMEVGVQVRSVPDGEVLYSIDVVYQGRGQLFSEWAADAARDIEGDIRSGLELVADWIVDELFLVAPGTYGQPVIDVIEITGRAIGHAPLEPKVSFALFGGSGPAGRYGWPRVERRPTLRWSPFPSRVDRSVLGPETLAAIEDVTYDLVVLRAEPPQKVYEVFGLREAEHTLEVPLLPDERYYWAVRSRFERGGVTQVTRWSTISWGGDPMRYWRQVPHPYHFRFRTRSSPKPRT